MSGAALVDNDVIIKIACYHLDDWFTEAFAGAPALMLKIGSYTARDRVKRSKSIIQKEAAEASLSCLLDKIDKVDPTEEEIELALQMEEAAAELNVEFDTGESQLLAILLIRGGALLLTGDKRAVIAISALEISGAQNRTACLEQLTMHALHAVGAPKLRHAVCSEPKVDKALTNCFGCNAQDVAAEEISSGLISYISDLRRKSADTLIGENSTGTLIQS